MNTLNNNEKFGDLINILALLIGLENLNENREQTAYNDVHEANKSQAEYLLLQVKSEFEKQNEMLEYQTNLIEKIWKEIEKNGS